MDKKQCSEECPYKNKGYRVSDGFGDFNKKILFIAHRADERVFQRALFGNHHEQAMIETDSGRSLTEILGYCNIRLEDIQITNILKCILSQSEKISEEAYICCEKNLKNQVETMKPQAIVAFGGFCFKYMFPEEFGGDFLKEVGKIYPYIGHNVLIEHHLSKIYRLEKPKEAERIRQFLKEQGAL